MSGGWVPIEDWQKAAADANKFSAALHRINGVCKLRAVSNDLLGKEDRIFLDIMAIIERATTK